jgi:hypothetical protein
MLKSKSGNENYFKICWNCNNELYINHCWSCRKNQDSRDPQNLECEWCKCGACYFDSYSANPFNKNNRFNEPKNSIIEHRKALIKEIDFFSGEYESAEMCDGCGIRPVTYRDEVYSLCEICVDQLFGD